MLLTASFEEKYPSRVYMALEKGEAGHVTRYFSAVTDPPPKIGELCPVAFLVEQQAGTTAQAHYHQADQFQVFVTGDGQFGKRLVDGVLVQYARAYTPYGPIVAGNEGIGYMTLRNGWDPGLRYMPDSRDELHAVGRPPRNVLSEIIQPASETSLAATASATCTAVLEPADDGLGGWLHRLPPRAALTGPDPARGRGQYWVVLGGELTDPTGKTLTPRSCFFVPPDDAPAVATAGQGGAEVLLLQFPFAFAAAARGGLRADS